MSPSPIFYSYPESWFFSEEARDRIRELKHQEKSYDKYFKDFERLCATQEVHPHVLQPSLPHSRFVQQASIKSLSTIYPSLFEDLAARRSDRVNAASGMGLSLLSSIILYFVLTNICSQSKPHSTPDDSQNLLKECPCTGGRSEGKRKGAHIANLKCLNWPRQHISGRNRCVEVNQALQEPSMRLSAHFSSLCLSWRVVVLYAKARAYYSSVAKSCNVIGLYNVRDKLSRHARMSPLLGRKMNIHQYGDNWEYDKNAHQLRGRSLQRMCWVSALGVCRPKMKVFRHKYSKY